MVVTNARKVEGQWDFDLSLKNEEINFLMNFAVVSLLQAGLLSIKEEEGEQEINLLEQLQDSDMFRA